MEYQEVEADAALVILGENVNGEALFWVTECTIMIAAVLTKVS
jgi:hypothetical protein